MTMVQMEILSPKIQRNHHIFEAPASSSAYTVPTKMKILSALPSSDSREESTKTEAVLRQRRDDDDDMQDNFVLVSTSMDNDSPSHAVTRQHRLDRFGFIANMDRHGNLLDDEEDGSQLRIDHVLTSDEQKTADRRVRKWKTVMDSVPPARMWLKGGRRRKLVLRRLRKGVPESQRATVWQWLADVPTTLQKNRGVYQRLVQEASETQPLTPPGETQTNKHSKSFKVIQDTIERDIHRTFPRHSMFYQEDLKEATPTPTNGERKDFSIIPSFPRISTAQIEDSNMGCLAESTRNIAAMIMELDGTPASVVEQQKNLPVHPDYVPPKQVLEGRGGQASLRRVLKAYSVYDREIGYCQGMNFIAGMFLTLMPEEESFWMLVGTHLLSFFISWFCFCLFCLLRRLSISPSNCQLL
jgi:hypothetical protein